MAHVESFEDFLLSKKRSEQDKFNGPERLENWLKSVADLYNKIDEWLSPFYDKGLIMSSRKEFQNFEDFIGSYETEKLVLYIGSQLITFKPVGTLIMGSFGRIEIVGPKKDVRLIQKKWDEWYFSLGRTEKKYIEISKQLLELAIQDVINGTSELDRK